MEEKYHDALEQIALLEADLAGRDDLQIELQRTKDELRDLTEELSVANTKLENMSAGNLVSQNKENRHPELARKSSRMSFHYQGIPEESAVSVNAPPLTYSSGYAKTSMHRMSSSRSLRKIHGMLDQMKNLESRVATFKSSLPKPITPTKVLVPSSPSRSRSSSRSAMRPTPEIVASAELPYSTQTVTPSTSNSNIPVSRFRNSPSMGNMTKTALAQEAQFGRSVSKGSDESLYPSSLARPLSPYRIPEDMPRRARSAAGFHTPHKKGQGYYGDLGPGKVPSIVANSIDEKLSSSQDRDFLRRHDSKRFGGSYQDSTRATSAAAGVALPEQSENNNNNPDEVLALSKLSLKDAPDMKPKSSSSSIGSGSSGGFESANSNSNSNGNGIGLGNSFYYPPRYKSKADASRVANGDSQPVREVPARPGSAFGMLHSRQPIGHGRM